MSFVTKERITINDSFLNCVFAWVLEEKLSDSISVSLLIISFEFVGKL